MSPSNLPMPPDWRFQPLLHSLVGMMVPVRKLIKWEVSVDHHFEKIGLIVSKVIKIHFVQRNTWRQPGKPGANYPGVPLLPNHQGGADLFGRADQPSPKSRARQGQRCSIAHFLGEVRDDRSNGAVMALRCKSRSVIKAGPVRSRACLEGPEDGTVESVTLLQILENDRIGNVKSAVHAATEGKLRTSV